MSNTASAVVALAFFFIIITTIITLVLALVIGGVYYLTARPRVGFREAISKRWVLLVSVVLAVLFIHSISIISIWV